MSRLRLGMIASGLQLLLLLSRDHSGVVLAVLNTDIAFAPLRTQFARKHPSPIGPLRVKRRGTNALMALCVMSGG